MLPMAFLYILVGRHRDLAPAFTKIGTENL